MWTKSFRNTDDRPEPRLYTHDTQLMPAGDGTKCSMLMEGLCLMHISWPLGPLSLFFLWLWCHILRILFVYLCPFLSLCSFCLLLGLESNYGKHTFTRLNMQKNSWVQNKPDGAFSSEDFAVWMNKAQTLPPARMAGSEMFHSRSASFSKRLRRFAGCGETKHRAGGSDPERREDTGVQPGGAGAGGGGGAARHRGPGRQDLRPERAETEPGQAHHRLATDQSEP